MLYQLSTISKAWLSEDPIQRDFVFDRSPALSSMLSPIPTRGPLERRINDLKTFSAKKRQALAHHLLKQNQGYGADASAVRAARSLVEPNTYAVLVQLRPAVLGGRAADFLKVLTAIEWARRLERDFAIRVVPVLWVLSDHNAAEMLGAWLVTPADEIRHLSMTPPLPPGCPAPKIQLRPGLDALLGAFDEQMSRSPYGATAFDLLKQTGADSQNLTEWFCRMMARIFSSYGVVVLDGSTPEIRRLTVPLMKRSLIRQYSIHNELEAGRERLLSAGYHPPVRSRPRETRLYVELGASRRRLQFDPEREGFFHQGMRSTLDPKGMAEVMAEEHEAFSPDAVLAPMVQEAVVPTLLGVISEGESGVRAQARTVFGCFEMTPAPVVPQISLTYCPHALLVAIQKRGLNPSTLLEPLPDVDALMAARDAHLDQLMERDLKSRLDELKGDIARVYHEGTRELVDEIPSLKPVLDATASRFDALLREVERKAQQHHRRRLPKLTGAYRRVANHLRPRGYPQERLNMMALLSHWGMDWLPACHAALREVVDLRGPFWMEEFVE